MPFTTLIDPDQLRPRLADSDWRIVDCRFNLDDTGLGRRLYEEGHIPGAVYAHLDEDLSGRVQPGKTGRHPLPSVDRAVETFSRLGIDDAVQVVAYDDAGGMYAGRLWWMLKWLGHDAVALLDGGWPAWVASGLPVESRTEAPERRAFAARLRPHLVATAADVARAMTEKDRRILDARAPDRYRGENESRDPVGGHIPGALCVPFAGNLDDQGRFLDPETLATRFRKLLGGDPSANDVCYCGSGVSAVHNLLAMAHAGLEMPTLYPGSWSEWVTDPRRPVATGTET